MITFEGNRDSLIRICLNKGHLAALNLTLKEVLAAVPAKQLEGVTGILYNNSKQPFDYIIKCKSAHDQSIAYGNRIIRTNHDTVLWLKNVAAKIEFSPDAYENITRINGKAGINIAVMQFPDSNYNEIQIAIKRLMETASTKFPAGVKHLILYNPKDSLYLPAE